VVGRDNQTPKASGWVGCDLALALEIYSTGVTSTQIPLSFAIPEKYSR
jgi:hypothetical protein